jgi:hypothetical protein
MRPKGDPSPMARASRERPCPVCGRPDWCMVGERMCVCARVEDGAIRKCGQAGHLHPLEKKDVVATPPKPKPKGGTDWGAVARDHAARPEVRAKRAALCRHLGLPPTGLDCFPLLGRGQDERGKFWTFPEVDAAGAVVGICRRYPDGKFQLPGGSRGLSVPHGLDVAGCDTLFVVEGPTDAAAMWCAGLSAVGRPSNSGGAHPLTQLLARCEPHCRVVVVGENDAKADGQWPGLHGAAAVAEQLAAGLQRRPGAKAFPVAWALCPPGAKDVREWLTGRSGAWADRGRDLRALLLAAATPAESVEKAVRKVLAENRELKDRLAAVEEAMRKLTGKE